MPREFSADFANRLGVATIRYVLEMRELKKTASYLIGSARAMDDQVKRQTGNQYIQISNTIGCFMNGKIEDVRCARVNARQTINRITESCRIFQERLRRMEKVQRALQRGDVIFKKIKLAMEEIKALNTIADEEVSVQRIETENDSDKTDGESTTVKVAERKISSEVDDGGSTAGTMEKVEESLTDRKLNSAIELQKSTAIDADRTREILEGVAQVEKCLAIFRRVKKCLGLPEETLYTDEKSKERFEKQSSSGVDQSSIADRIEAQQELSEASKNEAIELQTSTAIDADRTRELQEGLAKLDKCLLMLRLEKICLGLPEEASYTDEKSKERLEKQSSSGIDQSSIADRIQAQQELSQVAGRSHNEATELQTSTAIDAVRTLEGLAQLEKCLAKLRLVRKCVGFTEEASYTDQKSKERLEKLSLKFQELSSLFDELEAVKKEFLAL